MKHPDDRLTKPELALLATSLTAMTLSFAALLYGA